MGLPADYGILIVRVGSGRRCRAGRIDGGNERAYLGATPIMVGGDLVVAINGDPIGDQQDLANAMNKHRAGDTVSVTVYRGRKKMTVQVVLGEARDRA